MQLSGYQYNTGIPHYGATPGPYIAGTSIKKTHCRSILLLSNYKFVSFCASFFFILSLSTWRHQSLFKAEKEETVMIHFIIKNFQSIIISPIIINLYTRLFSSVKKHWLFILLLAWKYNILLEILQLCFVATWSLSCDWKNPASESAGERSYLSYSLSLTGQ